MVVSRLLLRMHVAPLWILLTSLLLAPTAYADWDCALGTNQLGFTDYDLIDCREDRGTTDIDLEYSLLPQVTIAIPLYLKDQHLFNEKITYGVRWVEEKQGEPKRWNFGGTPCSSRNSGCLHTGPSRVRFAHEEIFTIILGKPSIQKVSGEPHDRVIYTGKVANQPKSYVYFAFIKNEFIGYIVHSESIFSRYSIGGPSYAPNGEDLMPRVAPSNSPGNSYPIVYIKLTGSIKNNNVNAEVVMGNASALTGGSVDIPGYVAPTPTPKPTPKPKRPRPTPKPTPTPVPPQLTIGSSAAAHFSSAQAAIDALARRHSGLEQDTYISIEPGYQAGDLKIGTNFKLKRNKVVFRSLDDSSPGMLGHIELREPDHAGSIKFIGLDISSSGNCVDIKMKNNAAQMLDFELNTFTCGGTAIYASGFDSTYNRALNDYGMMSISGNSFEGSGTALDLTGDWRETDLLILANTLVSTGNGPQISITGKGDRVSIRSNRIISSDPGGKALLRSTGGAMLQNNIIYGPVSFVDNSNFRVLANNNTFVTRSGYNLSFEGFSATKRDTRNGPKFRYEKEYAYLFYNLFLVDPSSKQNLVGGIFTGARGHLAALAGNVFDGSINMWTNDQPYITRMEEHPRSQDVFRTVDHLNIISWQTPEHAADDFTHDPNRMLTDPFRFFAADLSLNVDSVAKSHKIDPLGDVQMLFNTYRPYTSIKSAVSAQSILYRNNRLNGAYIATSYPTHDIDFEKDFPAMFEHYIGADSIDADAAHELRLKATIGIIAIGGTGATSQDVWPLQSYALKEGYYKGLNIGLQRSYGVADADESVSGLAEIICNDIEKAYNNGGLPDILLVFSHSIGSYVLPTMYENDTITNNGKICHQYLRQMKVFNQIFDRPRCNWIAVSQAAELFTSIGEFLPIPFGGQEKCEQGSYVMGGDGNIQDMRTEFGVSVREKSYDGHSLFVDEEVVWDKRELIPVVTEEVRAMVDSVGAWEKTAFGDEQSTHAVESLYHLHINGYAQATADDGSALHAAQAVHNVIGTSQITAYSDRIDYDDGKDIDGNAKTLCRTLGSARDTDGTLVTGFSAGSHALAYAMKEVCPDIFRARKNIQVVLLDSKGGYQLLNYAGQVVMHVTLGGFIFEEYPNIVESCEWIRCFLEEHSTDNTFIPSCGCEEDLPAFDESTRDLESYYAVIEEAVRRITSKEFIFSNHCVTDQKYCISPRGLEDITITFWSSPGFHSPWNREAE